MRLAALLIALTPSLALAVGSDDEQPTAPVPTQTTKECKGVQVWDEKTKTCVDPQKSRLDPKILKEAVRELAYAGRNADAQGVLRALPDQTDDFVLTYWGFTHRRLGRMDLALDYYDRALVRNPDNLLARSYLGLAHVEAGRLADARGQLREIRARGGAGTWPETALAQAIATGQSSDY